MKKSIYALFLVFFTFLFSSCNMQRTVFSQKDFLKIDLEPEYNLNDDVILDISIGLCKEYQENYSSIPNFKYILAYSPAHPEVECEEHKILFIIEDFSSDKYFYSEEQNKINYNFKEKFSINNEVFAKSNGEIYVFLYSTTSDFTGREFTIIYKIIYEKSNEVLLLHLS